jgi:hypothetical protein
VWRGVAGCGGVWRGVARARQPKEEKRAPDVDGEAARMPRRDVARGVEWARRARRRSERGPRVRESGPHRRMGLAPALFRRDWRVGRRRGGFGTHGLPTRSRVSDLGPLSTPRNRYCDLLKASASRCSDASGERTKMARVR